MHLKDLSLAKKLTAGFGIIIALLIGILIPAVSVVRDMALDTKQMMQFTGIEIALEAFMSDSGYGDYPPSDNNAAGAPGDDDYTGSMKLAEALVGLDGFGWHPDSTFATYGWDGDNNPLYHGTNESNLRSRKGPYIDLEKANVIQLGDIYNGLDFKIARNYIFTDVYSTATNLTNGKSIGMPILYYRANTSGFYHSTEDNSSKEAWYNDTLTSHPDHVYEYLDNKPSGDRKQVLEDQPITGVTHPMFLNDEWTWFYEATRNPNIKVNATSGNLRPYNAQSFILQSAGPDGLYGTSDDKFNFDMSK